MTEHFCLECTAPLPHTEARDAFGNCLCFLLCERCAAHGRVRRLAPMLAHAPARETAKAAAR